MHSCRQMYINRKGELGQRLSLDLSLNIHEKGFITSQILKSKKYEIFCVSKLLIWRQKWVVHVRQLARRSSIVARYTIPFYPKLTFVFRVDSC